MRKKSFFNKVLNDATYSTAIELIYRMKNWCSAPSLFKETNFAEYYSCRRAELILEQRGC